MTRVLAFGSPYLLGFDRFERMAERLAKAGAESYPPYNVEDRGDGALRITLAVAGPAGDEPLPVLIPAGLKDANIEGGYRMKFVVKVNLDGIPVVEEIRD